MFALQEKSFRVFVPVQSFISCPNAETTATIATFYSLVYDCTFRVFTILPFRVFSYANPIVYSFQMSAATAFSHLFSIKSRLIKLLLMNKALKL